MFGDAFTRIYASATGLLLVAIGLLGFLVGSDFERPELTGSLFGFYAVNGWANSLHVVTGVIALGLAARASRIWAWIAAILFTGLGLWGILAPDGTLLAGLLPAPRAVNLINLALGLLAFGALAARPIQMRSERAARRKRARRVRPRVQAAGESGSDRQRSRTRGRS